MNRHVRRSDEGKTLTVVCNCGCEMRWTGVVESYTTGLKSNPPNNGTTDHDQFLLRDDPHNTRWFFIPYCEIIKDDANHPSNPSGQPGGLPRAW